MTEHADRAHRLPSPSPVAALAEMAPKVQYALVTLGLVVAVDELRALAIRADAGPVLTAITHLGAVALTAWVARRLLLAASAVLELFAAQAEATARLAATADRLVGVRERLPTTGSPVASPTAPLAPPVPDVAADPRKSALDAIRVAIRRGEWAQSEALIQDFAESYPDDRVVSGLTDDLAAAKRSVAAGLRSRIDAAREANDPERIFELHEALAPLLAPEVLRDLERDLSYWFMGQLQKRLRNGKISIDVTMLASRVAEAFATTPEGASLRAALPTLRRSVGLCARCGQPYNGIADACPSCLANASVTAPNPTPLPEDGDEDLEPTSEVAADEGFFREPE